MYTNRALQIHHEIRKARLVHSAGRMVKAALETVALGKAALGKAALV